MSSSLQQARPQHHTAAEVAKLEKQMVREENTDKNTLKAAQKELASAEKSLRKATKATDKSIHTHDKALKYEHKTEDRMKEAARRHDDAINNERKTSQDIATRQQKQQSAVHTIAEKKANLKRVEDQQEINASKRDERLAQFSATSETGPSAARGGPMAA